MSRQTVIESPILSPEGTHIALLKLTVTTSEMDPGTAVQHASDATAAMAHAPDDPTDQLPPTLSAAAAAATNQFDLWSILERLEGFIKLANLAAEVCHRLSVLRSFFDHGMTDPYLSPRFIRLLNSHGGSYQSHIR